MQYDFRLSDDYNRQMTYLYTDTVYSKIISMTTNKLTIQQVS